MQIVFALDHKEDEGYADWLNRKVQKEGFSLSVPELTALLAISPYSLRSYFNRDVPYIKNSGRVCYCHSKVDEWLMKHAVFTMATRTLNLLDFVSMAEIEKAEQKTGERFGMLMERDLDGRQHWKRMPGYMAPKLLSALGLPSFSLTYYHRKESVPVSVKPFPFLGKKLVHPKSVNAVDAPVSRRHPEQIYREAFMMGYCKISIGKRKTIWVPVRQKAPFVPWTIPIETKKIGEYVLPSLTPSDFMESGDEFPPVIKSRGKAKEMKR